ncbi:unnamed protein product [Blepharisma stoltei]|uniref:Uncharacterized protein n=1 Tax=Blepharisma stoltei TaxID=1481888 RepID=A0AAU9K2Y0_9CILI|nr:unnamed protein product [Blepharisma stoltei]
MENMIMRRSTLSPVKTKINDNADLLNLDYKTPSPIKKNPINSPDSEQEFFQYLHGTGEKSSKIAHKRSMSSVEENMYSYILKDKISGLLNSHKQIMNELLNDKSPSSQLDFQEKLKELSLENSKLVLENIALKKQLANRYF